MTKGKNIQNNKTILVAIAMMAVLMIPAQVFATHQTSPWTWSAASLPVIVRGTSSLNNLNIDGSTGQALLAQDLIMQGAQKWNDVGTAFQLQKGSTGTHLITAGPIDGAGDSLALTNCSIDADTNEILDCDTKYDEAELWSANDNSNLKVLKFVATHEFGHWVWLHDIGDDPGEDPFNPPTTMVVWYEPTLINAVQAHDAEALGVMYP